MALIKDRAFIIKNKRFKEADKLVTFFGRNMGKSQAIAKSAQKPEVRKSGSLETGSIIKLAIAEGYKIDILTEVEVTSPTNASRDINKALLYIAELVDKYTIEHDSDYEVFDLLEGSVKDLHKSKNTLFIANEIHLKLMQKAGLMPEFTHCAKTGEVIKAGEMVYLSESGPIVRNFPTPLPTWPLIKSDYFLVLSNHADYEDSTTVKTEKNIFKILNFIAEKTLEKTLISKNLFKLG
jgi:DNA repair protein RecO (recombination protein O)